MGTLTPRVESSQTCKVAGVHWQMELKARKSPDGGGIEIIPAVSSLTLEFPLQPNKPSDQTDFGQNNPDFLPHQALDSPFSCDIYRDRSLLKMSTKYDSKQAAKWVFSVVIFHKSSTPLMRSFQCSPSADMGGCCITPSSSRLCDSSENVISEIQEDELSGTLSLRNAALRKIWQKAGENWGGSC
nr:patatin-like protein 2 [Ipomoea batatas]